MERYAKERASMPEDTLLLMRLGDFYEMFFEDATRGAKAMGIALCHTRQGIPMAGISCHAVDSYIKNMGDPSIKTIILSDAGHQTRRQPGQ